MKYKCGHNSKGIIIMDSNPWSIASYLEWKDTVGFEGTKEQCLECWCNNECKRKSY